MRRSMPNALETVRARRFLPDGGNERVWAFRNGVRGRGLQGRGPARMQMLVSLPTWQVLAVPPQAPTVEPEWTKAHA